MEILPTVRKEMENALARKTQQQRQLEAMFKHQQVHGVPTAGSGGGGGGEAKGCSGDQHHPNCPNHPNNKMQQHQHAPPHPMLHGVVKHAADWVGGSLVAPSYFSNPPRVAKSGDEPDGIIDVQKFARDEMGDVSSYDPSSGIETFWVHKYHPDQKESNLNQVVTEYIQIMRDQHGVPWVTICAKNVEISPTVLIVQKQAKKEKVVLKHQGIEAVQYVAQYLQGLDKIQKSIVSSLK
jgi:hypothetical protein